MSIHVLQHVHFEDEAYIGVWAKQKGYEVQRTALYGGDSFPTLDSLDLLVVMGGPMGVYDEAMYPWLVEEKQFLEKAITAGKKIIGICLGAQLLADVLGARVYKNRYPEIGWFPVRKKFSAEVDYITPFFPETFTPFHWHGDTFDIPAGAVGWAESEACPSQAFNYGNNVVALQFHLESTAGSIGLLLQNCRDEVTDGAYVQDATSIAGSPGLIADANLLMEKVMDALHRA